MIERLNRFLGQSISMRSLGIVRMLVGAITLLHLREFVEPALEGDTYQDYFYNPYVAWYPELPEPAYAALLVLGCIAAVAMCAGLWTQVVTKVTFGVVAYNLLLSTTHVHNNRAYLAIVLGLLALAPCGRAFSLDALWRRLRGRPFEATGPAYPLWLLRFEAVAVYAASGFSKLIDPDWFGGTVTYWRMVTIEANVRASWLPEAFADLVVNRDFHTVIAKVIVGTELFIAAGLWWRWTRPFAVLAAIGFHVMIEVTSNVQIFSYLCLAMLFIWADPAMPWLRDPKGWLRRARGYWRPAEAAGVAASQSRS